MRTCVPKAWCNYTLPGLPHMHAVMLSRHADVQAVLRDARFGRAGFRQAAANALGEGALLDSYSQWFLFQDPPDHTRLRGLVSKAFTPRAVENLRQQIDAVVEQLLDEQQGKTSFDLMGGFAYQVPVLVICELLGVPCLIAAVSPSGRPPWPRASTSSPCPTRTRCVGATRRRPG